MTRALLARRTAAEILVARGPAVSPEALDVAAPIVRAVRQRGEPALREYAERFGEIAPGGELVLYRDRLRAALDSLPAEGTARLERVAGRIRSFAEAQRAVLGEVDAPIPVGRAGHTVAPVERVGCDAPGGRYPLPSSVLMTAVTARVAGVGSVGVASPRPSTMTLAAAAVAGADAVLAAGGAQAIAALAYGAGPVPSSDVIVGPGNRYVTAAKQLVSIDVKIDQLAGPSELVVLADASADPAIVAADLLALAEHDPDALPVLVTRDDALVAAVNCELACQIEGLQRRRSPGRRSGVEARWSPRRWTTRSRRAIAWHPSTSRWSPTTPPPWPRASATSAPSSSARTLPRCWLTTGRAPTTFPDGPGGAPWRGGLSVIDFLRIRTWLRIEDPAARASWPMMRSGLPTHRGIEGACQGRRPTHERQGGS